MAKYLVEVYQLHSQVYLVEADSEADAVKKYQNGEGVESDDAPEYLEDSEEHGMPIDREFEDELAELDVSYEGEWLRGIRSVELVKETEEKTT